MGFDLVHFVADHLKALLKLGGQSLLGGLVLLVSESQLVLEVAGDLLLLFLELG